VTAQATVEPAPAPTEPAMLFESLRKTINEKPMLAVAIGAGLLVLIVLIVVLIVVLLRGRGVGEAEPAQVAAPEEFSPAPEWSPKTTMPRGGVASAIDQGRTEAAPGGWGEADMGTSPFGQPPGGMPAGQGGVPAGGTRVIERASRHLAILVDKRSPNRKFDLQGTMNIGRATDNQITVEHATVSRYHAWIREQAGDLLVFDVGSANGTFVNDHRVEEPHRLENGDVVRFGDVEFAFTRVF